MKVYVAFALLMATVMAEPPRYHPQQRQFYFARQQEETTIPANAPYPPSGSRPTGPAFNLPQRTPQRQYAAPSTPPQYAVPAAAAAPQQQYRAPAAPQQQYGVPQQQQGASSALPQTYGPPVVPQQQYGPPQVTTTTEVPSTTEAEDVTTVASVTDSESEPVNSVNELDDEVVDEQQPQQSGEYYVALPDGRLQRVRYVSRQNIEAMRYFAKIRAENVEPLRGPIYAYAPLQKLQIVPAGLQVSVAPVAPIAAAAAAAAAPSAESKPQKLEIQPVATQVQYQYDNPAGVLPLAAYAGPSDSRYLLTLP